ncbi:MAG: hypothetical protein LBI05_12055 [Planctomycetaceae bacterium]|jgi:hypothetical protein|nr:hypothetical protein [Planctomycetaceae bacterium]
MMKHDFQKMLDIFAYCGTHKICEACTIQCLSDVYLRKYWLHEEEWQSRWVLLWDHIFCPDAFTLPDMMFREGFMLIAGIGGCAFAEGDFHALQKCMREIGDKEFVMIENGKKRNLRHGVILSRL